MCALGGWDSHWEFPNLGMSILMPSLILMSYSVSLSWFLIVNYTKKNVPRFEEGMRIFQS